MALRSLDVRSRYSREYVRSRGTRPESRVAFNVRGHRSSGIYRLLGGNSIHCVRNAEFLEFPIECGTADPQPSSDDGHAAGIAVEREADHRGFHIGELSHFAVA